MPPFLSVVVADDHPVILIGLMAAIARFPQLRVVAQAHDGRELVHVLDHIGCDVIVTDFNLNGDPAYDGMQLLARVRKQHPAPAVVACTMVSNPALLRTMRQIGVAGFVSKRDELMHVGHAIHAAARGASYYSPRILEGAGFPINERDAPLVLSAREREVVRLYVSGMPVSEIARRFGSSVKTVSTQKAAALRKLGLARETELFQYVRASGVPFPR
ncbi:Transcriptional regulatory protein RcsB [Ralstonia condita]|jgi:two-component system capsular synthesis response regulator RcsB|uniref:Transcriptional regulatory protein RcsB n=1 Tax=Ralstonia condita TaxID=3058600 RepID=A0ABM9JFE5_9RALS|nr:response regulator transcription factor [Ralstonia sp. LMG 7141]MDE2201237.1 response regulator transcription factor [Burkholderiaceae bacterium]CAJ0791981.1 Transcriptional regulatory protein RcsB [Ralstonia sp. LMG 7141]